MMQRQAAIWIFLAFGAALAVIALVRPELLSGGRGVWMLYSALMLAYVGSAGVVYARFDPGGALRDAVAWVALVVALGLGYRIWQAWVG